MTTVGVTSKLVDRVHAMEMPSYTYHYPHFKRVQLAAVKEGIYHPRLPTLRRMDMDDTRGLLTDMHNRTTTSCGPDDFTRAKTSYYRPPSERYAGMNFTEMGRAHHKQYTTPQELTNARAEWSEFLTRCPERYDINLPELPDKKDLHFAGYAVRYLRPDLTRCWKPYSLTHEPNIHQYDQRPTPATSYGRYRDPYPKNYRSVSSSPWYQP